MVGILGARGATVGSLEKIKTISSKDRALRATHVLGKPLSISPSRGNLGMAHTHPRKTAQLVCVRNHVTYVDSPHVLDQKAMLLSYEVPTYVQIVKMMILMTHDNQSLLITGSHNLLIP